MLWKHKGILRGSRGHGGSLAAAIPGLQQVCEGPMGKDHVEMPSVAKGKVQ